MGAVAAAATFDGGGTMNGTEFIALGASVCLLVYLLVALLKPEWFA
jgi:K+-transporting ATPase KdpF subunit